MSSTIGVSPESSPSLSPTAERQEEVFTGPTVDNLIQVCRAALTAQQWRHAIEMTNGGSRLEPTPPYTEFARCYDTGVLPNDSSRVRVIQYRISGQISPFMLVQAMRPGNVTSFDLDLSDSSIRAIDPLGARLDKIGNSYQHQVHFILNALRRSGLRSLEVE